MAPQHACSSPCLQWNLTIFRGNLQNSSTHIYSFSGCTYCMYGMCVHRTVGRSLSNMNRNVMLDKLPPCFLFALSSECIHHQKRVFLCNSSSIQIHTLILEPSMKIDVITNLKYHMKKLSDRELKFYFTELIMFAHRHHDRYSIMRTHHQYLHTLVNAMVWSMVGLSKCQVGKMASIKHNIHFCFLWNIEGFK